MITGSDTFDEEKVYDYIQTIALIMHTILKEILIQETVFVLISQKMLCTAIKYKLHNIYSSYKQNNLKVSGRTHHHFRTLVLQSTLSLSYKHSSQSVVATHTWFAFLNSKNVPKCLSTCSRPLNARTVSCLHELKCRQKPLQKAPTSCTLKITTHRKLLLFTLSSWCVRGTSILLYSNLQIFSKININQHEVLYNIKETCRLFQRVFCVCIIIAAIRTLTNMSELSRSRLRSCLCVLEALPICHAAPASWFQPCLCPGSHLPCR